MRYFKAKGLCGFAGVAFFGASKFEPRNQQTWVAGEPAFLKIWVASPALTSLDAILEAEEGFAPSLAAAAVEAELAGRGVDTRGFQRIPSLSDPGAVALQWTLRRAAPLTLEEAAADESAPFALDACPGAAGLGGLVCY